MSKTCHPNSRVESAEPTRWRARVRSYKHPPVHTRTHLQACRRNHAHIRREWESGRGEGTDGGLPTSPNILFLPCFSLLDVYGPAPPMPTGECRTANVAGRHTLAANKADVVNSPAAFTNSHAGYLVAVRRRKLEHICQICTCATSKG